MASPTPLTLMALCMTGLASCSSPALKAPSAQLSSFLGKEPSLTNNRKVSPFALSGGSLVTTLPGIYIEPVSLAYLRESSKFLAKDGDGDQRRLQAARKLADYARDEFTAAFKNSPTPRYSVRTSPGMDSITLQLALTELNRNSLTGTVTRFAVNTVAIPGTDVALAKATRGLKGNIAIEGKVTCGIKGPVIYQFADQEESKSAFLLPINDLAAYGQARQAIRDWARQFEQITRAAPGQRVKDSSVMSLF